MLEVCVIIAGLVLDRVSKWLVVTRLKPMPGGELALWPGVFHLKYVPNRGAAFGMLEGGQIVLIVIGIAAAAGIAYLLISRRSRYPKWVRVAMAMVAAGALGNVIDRIIQGFVTDFAYFKLIDFAVFNVADSLLVIGFILIAIYMVFVYKEPGKDGVGA